MADPVLQVFVDRVVPRTYGTPPAVGWRLVAGNRREVGRSAVALPSVTAAVDHFVQVRRDALDGRLRPVLSSRASEGGWRWALDSGETPVARSHRAYSRRRECLAPLEQFLLLLVSTGEDPRVVELPDLLRQRAERPCAPTPPPTRILDVRPRRNAPLPATDEDVPPAGLHAFVARSPVAPVRVV